VTTSNRAAPSLSTAAASHCPSATGVRVVVVRGWPQADAAAWEAWIAPQLAQAPFEIVSTHDLLCTSAATPTHLPLALSLSLVSPFRSAQQPSCMRDRASLPAGWLNYSCKWQSVALRCMHDGGVPFVPSLSGGAPLGSMHEADSECDAHECDDGGGGPSADASIRRSVQHGSLLGGVVHFYEDVRLEMWSSVREFHRALDGGTGTADEPSPCAPASRMDTHARGRAALLCDARCCVRCAQSASSPTAARGARTSSLSSS
jgi:hypothetical protein